MVRFVEDDPEQPGDDVAGLAPVIPLFGRDGGSTRRSRGEADGHAADLAVSQRRHPAGSARSPWGRASGRQASDPGAETTDAVAAAERTLVRKLAARSLSVAEARAVLSGFELQPDEAQAILTVFQDRGYLDDAALAEQIVHVAVDRKGEGRRAIGAALAKRGVPREIAAAALAELPDDDRERALDFARTRARALRGLDPDVALRRLVGQLARRGYPGHVAMDAARTALADAG